MKPLFLLACLLILSIISCQGPGGGKGSEIHTDTAYMLTGRITGLDSGWVFLLHRQSEGETNKTDSAMIRNGVFIFTGRAASPEFVNLGIFQDGNKQYRTGFFLQNGTLDLKAKKDSLGDDDAVIITGSPTQDELKTYNKGLISVHVVERSLDSLYGVAENTKNKALEDSVVSGFKALQQQEKNFVKDYARKHPASYVAAFQVYNNYSYNADPRELDSLYNGLDSTIRVSYYGKKIKDVLDIAKKTDNGQPAPDFTSNDPKGRPISLASFKGKYVLIDFWASWCGPCRKENPAVVKAFHRFHSKGFDILGVSLDDDKAKWLEAIKKDHLTWTHVSDLKGWQNATAKLYGIRGIPMNFLLDKDGKIIARGLRGESLEQELEKLFLEHVKG